MALLEADVAYFYARLELLGEPSTSNQTAQRKAFRQLSRLPLKSGGGGARDPDQGILY